MIDFDYNNLIEINKLWSTIVNLYVNICSEMLPLGDSLNSQAYDIKY